MSYIQRQLVTVGVALALGACASAAQKDVGFYPRTASETTVVVKNNNWSEMAIYVLTSGTRWRIGSIMGTSSASLRIPENLLSGPDVQFQADPVGPDPALTFARFALRAGSKVELNLENNLRFSSFSIW